MNNSESIANELEQNAKVIAAAATELLQAKDAKLFSRLGSNAQQLWMDHLSQRVLELSAAVAANNEQMFVSRVEWSKAAMSARKIDSAGLNTSLQSMRDGIASVLGEANCELAWHYIDHAAEKLDSSNFDLSKTALDAGVMCDALALEYVQTVASGNVFPGMQLILDAVSRGMTVQDAYLKVLLPAQTEVGRLWHINELSVSEEHLISNTTYRLMAVLSTRMPRKPDNGYTVVAGAVAGNIHDMGIRAISYLLEFEGWHTLYLGADIPRAELPALLSSYEADLIMLSVALSSQISATHRAVNEIRGELGDSVKIMLGGNGLRDQPDLWRSLGADAYASGALEALEVAESLVKR